MGPCDQDLVASILERVRDHGPFGFSCKSESKADGGDDEFKAYKKAAEFIYRHRLLDPGKTRNPAGGFAVWFGKFTLHGEEYLAKREGSQSGEAAEAKPKSGKPKIKEILLSLLRKCFIFILGAIATAIIAIFVGIVWSWLSSGQ